MTTIGKYIKEIRSKKGLSQADMAKKMQMSRPTFIQIENNNRELAISEAEKLASILGISFEELRLKRTPRDIEVTVNNKTSSLKQTTSTTLRIDVPQKHLDKFKEVLLYICEKISGQANVGQTVLYKILYFIDFDFYERYEEQLIGATYIKNHYGPTPVEFIKLIDDMKHEHDIEEIKSKYFKYPQTKYLPLRKANLSLLTAIEKDHIDWELARLADKSAKELSDFSHKDVPWITAEDNQAIDYEAVFYRTDATSVRRYDDDDL